MITIAILILIVAKALPGLNTHISSIHVTRITSIVFLFAGALSLNSFFIESIGSGIGIYSGLFQVTTISQLIEIFLFMIGGGILIAWPQFKHNFTFSFLPLLESSSALRPNAYPPLGEGDPNLYFEFLNKDKKEKPSNKTESHDSFLPITSPSEGAPFGRMPFRQRQARVLASYQSS